MRLARGHPMRPDASGLIAGRLLGRRCLVTSNDMNDRFQRGDHLQVRRPMLYNHHGIYVSDDRVIQFGGGIWDKPHAVISAVSLKDFERDGTARVVRHGRDSWFTGHLRPARVGRGSRTRVWPRRCFVRSG